MVPVKKPIGHKSVNIKPIKAVVINTNPIKIKYLIYLSLGSIGSREILFINGIFFNFLARGAVILCNKPIGHAHPQIARPLSTPKKPMIKIGKRKSFHLKLFLNTLTSNARSGQAEVEAGQELQ